MQILRRTLCWCAALAFLLSATSQTSSQSSSEKPAAEHQAAPPSSAELSAKVPAPRPDDVKSIDSILAAVYDVISGPPGIRNWDRFRSLFLPDGRLTSAAKGSDGVIRIHAMSVEDYARLAGGYFAQHGFFEKSLVNRIETFGNATQVFSSYESRHAAGEAPFARGINSIQLLNDGTRFWIVSILWDEERSDNPLPKPLAVATPEKHQ